MTSLVTLAVDPGTSLTKCIYQVDGGAPQLLALPPEAVKLPRGLEDTLQEQCRDSNLYGKTNASELIWYAPDKEGDLYAVGALACHYQQEVDIKRLKYESAEIKILGIIGAIAQQESLSRFTIHIAMLLPFGEYRDGDKLHHRLKEKLSRSFYWHGRTRIRAKLGNWSCYPEGSGRMLAYMEEIGAEEFNRRNVVVLMLGHRNASILKMLQGRDSGESESSDRYGFYRFIDHILESKSGYSSEDFMGAITAETSTTRLGDLPTEYRIDAEKVAHLRNRYQSNIEQESQDIDAAIASARLRYTQSLEDWIERKTYGEKIDKILFCGGACLFFKEELEKFNVSEFAADIAGVGGDNIDSNNDSVQSLGQALDLNESQLQSIGYRLVDVFALFNYFRPTDDDIKKASQKSTAVYA